MKIINWVKKRQLWFLYGLFILVFTCIFATFNFLMVFVSDEVQNINYGLQLSQNIRDKNLTIPYPDFDNALLPDEYVTKNDYISHLFNKSVNDYMSDIKQNYYYSEDYDCKYWSFVHTMYFAVVKDRFNYNLKYVTTNNHIFVMLYNESGYCILDGDDYKCLMRV